MVKDNSKEIYLSLHPRGVPLVSHHLPYWCYFSRVLIFAVIEMTVFREYLFFAYSLSKSRILQQKYPNNDTIFKSNIFVVTNFCKFCPKPRKLKQIRYVLFAQGIFSSLILLYGTVTAHVRPVLISRFNSFCCVSLWLRQFVCIYVCKEGRR